MPAYHRSESVRLPLALVAGRDASVAVLTDLLVTRVSAESFERVTYQGDVSFSEKAVRQLESAILPLIDSVGLPPCNYQLEVVNTSAASSRDAAISIDGFSADLPISLGMLAVSLGVPLKRGLLATGHIAGSGGDVRMVRGLAAKLKAAVASGMTEFLYPDLEADQSHEQWFRQEHDNLRAFLKSQRPAIKLHPVRTVAEAIFYAFDEADLVRAAFNTGHFGEPFPNQNDALGLASVFAQSSERFTGVVRQSLYAGNLDSLSSLLTDWAGYVLARGRYPNGWGALLHGLLLQTPPATRRMKLNRPLMDIALVERLASLASSEQQNDLDLLRAFACGQILGDSNPRRETAHESESLVAFGHVLDALRRATLTESIDRLIWDARAGFPLESTKVADADAFHATLDAYYRHLFSALGELEPTVDSLITEAEATAVLAEAYNGDTSLPLNNALAGRQGGMSEVLDRVSAYLIQKRRSERVAYILAQAVDFTSSEERAGFAAQILRLGKDILGEDYLTQSALFWADRLEVLLDAFLQAEYRIQSIFRAKV